MSKVILAIIIVVILAIVVLGLYLVMVNPASNAPVDNQNTNTNNNQMFTIQGMNIEVLKEGSGEVSKTGDSVIVHYVGTLQDGSIFDSSVNRNAPFTFTLGGQVIAGWNLGVVGMKVGEKRKLTIPPALAYGENGVPPVIPKNATLIFEVEMLKIN